MHCDKHVVKMILEHAQMMCTTHHIYPRYDIKYKIPYKQTHMNHPCSKWVRASLSNYKWLYKLTYHLNDEYKLRFNHDVNHKSFDVIDNLPLPRISDLGLTRFATAMPVEYKINNDSIKSYINYYKKEKIDIAKFTIRNNWLTSKA